MDIRIVDSSSCPAPRTSGIGVTANDFEDIVRAYSSLDPGKNIELTFDTVENAASARLGLQKKLSSHPDCAGALVWKGRKTANVYIGRPAA